MTPEALYFKILEVIEKEKPAFVARNVYHKYCGGASCFCPLMLAIDPDKRTTNPPRPTFAEFVGSELGISASNVLNFYKGYDCPMSKSNHPFTKLGRAVYRMLKRMGYIYNLKHGVMVREKILD